MRGSRRHLPEAGELRDIYLLSVVTAALIRGALLHALRPATTHLTVKPSRGGLLVKVSYVSRTTTLWCIWCDSCYVREAQYKSLRCARSIYPSATRFPFSFAALLETVSYITPLLCTPGSVRLFLPS